MIIVSISHPSFIIPSIQQHSITYSYYMCVYIYIHIHTHIYMHSYVIHTLPALQNIASSSNQKWDSVILMSLNQNQKCMQLWFHSQWYDQTDTLVNQCNIKIVYLLSCSLPLPRAQHEHYLSDQRVLSLAGRMEVQSAIPQPVSIIQKWNYIIFL